MEMAIKKRFESTDLEKKQIENSNYFSRMPTNDFFQLGPKEQLSLNIKVGLLTL